MADSLWIDELTFAQWEDDELTVIVDTPWRALKGAGDERQAYAEQTHSSGFDADYTFPDFSDLKSLFASGSGSPNNAVKIKNNLMPDNLGVSGSAVLSTVETSTIKADGTAIASAEANYLTYAEILTGPLGYASGTFLHMTDTANGIDNALLRMAWVVQWYRYMSYTKYFAKQLDTGIDNFFDEVEHRSMVLNVGYDYNSTTNTFIGANAFYTNPPNGTVDLYATNDLNEAAPFSTEQEVWDYTVATFDGELATADWESMTGGGTIRSTATMTIDRDLGPDDITEYSANIEQRQVRFKVNESFRALSPDKFQAALYFYFYITEPAASITTFNNLGVGLDEDESKFLELTADVSEWYYLEPVTAPDFDDFTPPTRPITTDIVTNSEGYEGFALNNEGGGHTNDIIVETNDPAGTAFEYYTP